MLYSPDIFIQNVYFLAKQQNKRIGEIENSANLSTGYLSRMKNDSRSTTPNIETVSSIAEYLGVTVDALISEDFSHLTTTDGFIVAYIEKLILNSHKRITEWKNTKKKTLSNILTCSANDYDDPYLILFSLGRDDITYQALYDRSVNPNIEEIFTASIDDATIIVIPYYESGDPLVDMYMVTKGLNGRLDTNYLASSFFNPFRDVLSRLIDTIKKTFDYIDLDENVITVMRNYMNNT